MSWQVQEAKQRLSEVLRAVREEGPQTITRHGKEIAVVVDIDEYQRLIEADRDVIELLTSFPKLEVASGHTDVFDDIEAERRADTGRRADILAELGIDSEPER